MHEKQIKDNETLSRRVERAQNDYQHQIDQSNRLAGENSQKNAELKLKEEEVQRLKQDFLRGSKLRDGLQKKLRSVEEQKAEIENNKEQLKQQIHSLERGTCMYMQVPVY